MESEASGLAIIYLAESLTLKRKEFSPVLEAVGDHMAVVYPPKIRP